MGFLVQPQVLLSIGPNRTFGGISGYVTLTESTIDKITITKQPVQQGANMSDHAFKEPVSFSIQILFGFSLTKSLDQVYQELLALQSTFVPFSVVTPKRTYPNMLLAVLGQTTDKKTENCLAINITFEETIIVPVTTTTVARSQLKKPGSNGGTQKVGKKSAAKIIFGGG